MRAAVLYTAIFQIGALAILALVATDALGGVPDCNDNGVPDDADLAEGTSPDCDADGVPDECGVDPLFATTVVMPDFGVVSSVVGADLDGDGDDDLLVAEARDGQILWFENLDGRGNFGAGVVIDEGLDYVGEAIAADLDGDGDLDVAAGVTLTDGVRWYENTSGKGDFGVVHTVPPGTDPFFALFAGDVDGDGDLDLVAGSVIKNRVEWFQNIDGAGTFGPGQVIAVSIQVYSVAMADLDGDGDGDVLATAYVADRVMWFRNLGGTAGFGPATILATPNAARDVIAADIDGDGDQDVVWAANGEGTAWQENIDGQGTFAAPQVVSPKGWAVAAVDMDRDGDLDLVNVDNAVLWFENLDGAGVFGPAQIVATLHGGRTVWTGDLDADLDPDVVSGHQAFPRLIVSRNSLRDCDGNGVPDVCDVATGTLADCTANGTPDVCEPDCNNNGVGDSCDILSGASLDCSGNHVPDECEPDCNQNGFADSCDIATGTSLDCDGNGIADDCESDCNGNWVEDSCDIDDGTSLDCDGNGIPDACELDCNGNGAVDSCDLIDGVSVDCNGNRVPDECDIAAGTSGDCNGNGTADECEPECNGNSVPDECDIAAGISTDCDGDGVLDECNTRIEFTMGILPGSGGGYPRELHAGDIDGDGDLDAVESREFEIHWFPNEGGGVQGQARSVDSDGGREVFAVDLDGDGDVDVLSHDNVYPFWVENLDGAGTFAPRQDLATDLEGSASVYPADLDGDGDIDLVEPSSTQNLLSWHENLGDAVFVRRTIGTPVGPSSVRASDFDGDGDIDVLCAASNPDLAWYENLDGLGSFGPARPIVAEDLGYFWQVADMDGDGDGDILAAGGGSSGSLRMYRNLDGAGTMGPAEIDAKRTGASGLAAADLDADGDLDIVSNAYFAESGQVTSTVWFENLDGQAHFGEPRPIYHAPRGESALHVADIDGDGDLDVLSNNQELGWIRWHRNLSNDCNGNRLPDTCEPDCDANGIADACDTTCAGECDIDADACLDAFDCDPSDGSVWGPPGAARNLTVSGAVTTTIAWLPPVGHGGASMLRYDLLRSPRADDFTAPAQCVTSDATDTSAEDSFVPAPDGLAYYLVRVENDCPGSAGAFGNATSGEPRVGRDCP